MSALLSKWKLSLLSLAAVGFANVAQAEDVVLDQPNGEKWTIAINAFPTPAPPEKDYQKVYNSIPFSRAEFEANPSYRHDATMEILTGQLRPGGSRVEVKIDPSLTQQRSYYPGFSGMYYPLNGYYLSPYSIYAPSVR